MNEWWDETLHAWRVVCLEWRYMLRDPWDVRGNEHLAAEITRLRKRRDS